MTLVPTGPAAGATAPTDAALDREPPGVRRRRAGAVMMASRAAAPMLGSASPRKPSVVMRARSSSGELAGGVPLHAQRQLVRVHAAAVIGDLDPLDAAACEPHGDARGAGVQRVLDQLAHRRRRPLDHLAGGDAVDRGLGQQADARRTPSPRPSPMRERESCRPLPLGEGRGERPRAQLQRRRRSRPPAEHGTARSARRWSRHASPDRRASPAPGRG